jgi:hypothetical protein
MKSLHITFTFYRSFIIPETFLNLLSCYLIWQAGSGKIILYLFWMKVIANAFIGIFIHLFQAQQLYFFNNLGYSAKRLYIHTAALDFLIWICLSLITLLFL